MTYLLIYIFIAYGISIIVTEGQIFENLRTWVGNRSDFLYSIITCPLCFSTWLGFLMSTILILTNNQTPANTAFDFPKLFIVFLDGMFTAGGVWFLYKLTIK